MTPDTISAIAHDMPPHDDPEWPFEAARRAHRFEAIISEGESLRGVASRVITLAKEEGFLNVVGTSASGQRIAAAAVALAKNGLRIAPAEGPLQEVLLIDGLVATGVQLLRGFHEARTRGATRIGAVAVASLLPPGRIGDPTLVETLIVLSD